MVGQHHDATALTNSMKRHIQLPRFINDSAHEFWTFDGGISTRHAPPSANLPQKWRSALSLQPEQRQPIRTGELIFWHPQTPLRDYLYSRW